MAMWAMLAWATAAEGAADAGAEAATAEEAGTKEVSSETSAAAGSTEQIAATYVLKVASRDEARQVLVDRAEELGGWFASLDEEAVSLRVPSERVQPLLDTVEALGLVAEREYSSHDVRQRIAELDARIASRRELLGQYFELLDQAEAKAVLQLEREISNTISQVESLEGQRRQLADTAAVARVHVRFQFRDRRRPGGAQPSPFRWINSLAVEVVEGDLRRSWHRGDKRTGLPRLEVEGFANYKLKRESRATSPDGVVVRSRAVKHKPRAELAYWTEAVQTHLMAHGYVLLADEELPGARWLEWAIPVGQEDHTYVVTVKPDGRRLELVEAAGPSEAFMARRDAVLAGVEAAVAAP